MYNLVQTVFCFLVIYIINIAAGNAVDDPDLASVFRTPKDFSRVNFDHFEILERNNFDPTVAVQKEPETTGEEVPASVPASTNDTPPVCGPAAEQQHPKSVANAQVMLRFGGDDIRGKNCIETSEKAPSCPMPLRPYPSQNYPHHTNDIRYHSSYCHPSYQPPTVFPPLPPAYGYPYPPYAFPMQYFNRPEYGPVPYGVYRGQQHPEDSSCSCSQERKNFLEGNDVPENISIDHPKIVTATDLTDDVIPECKKCPGSPVNQPTEISPPHHHQNISNDEFSFDKIESSKFPDSTTNEDIIDVSAMSSSNTGHNTDNPIIHLAQSSPANVEDSKTPEVVHVSSSNGISHHHHPHQTSNPDDNSQAKYPDFITMEDVIDSKWPELVYITPPEDNNHHQHPLNPNNYPASNPDRRRPDKSPDSMKKKDVIDTKGPGVVYTNSSKDHPSKFSVSNQSVRNNETKQANSTDFMKIGDKVESERPRVSPEDHSQHQNPHRTTNTSVSRPDKIHPTESIHFIEQHKKDENHKQHLHHSTNPKRTGSTKFPDFINESDVGESEKIKVVYVKPVKSDNHHRQPHHTSSSISPNHSSPEVINPVIEESASGDKTLTISGNHPTAELIRNRTFSHPSVYIQPVVVPVAIHPHKLAIENQPRKPVVTNHNNDQSSTVLSSTVLSDDFYPREAEPGTSSTKIEDWLNKSLIPYVCRVCGRRPKLLVTYPLASDKAEPDEDISISECQCCRKKGFCDCCNCRRDPSIPFGHRFPSDVDSLQNVAGPVVHEQLQPQEPIGRNYSTGYISSSGSTISSRRPFGHRFPSDVDSLQHVAGPVVHEQRQPQEPYGRDYPTGSIYSSGSAISSSRPLGHMFPSDVDSLQTVAGPVAHEQRQPQEPYGRYYPTGSIYSSGSVISSSRPLGHMFPSDVDSLQTFAGPVAHEQLQPQEPYGRDSPSGYMSSSGSAISSSRPFGHRFPSDVDSLQNFAGPVVHKQRQLQEPYDRDYPTGSIYSSGSAISSSRPFGHRSPSDVDSLQNVAYEQRKQPQESYGGDYSTGYTSSSGSALSSSVYQVGNQRPKVYLNGYQASDGSGYYSDPSRDIYYQKPKVLEIIRTPSPNLPVVEHTRLEQPEWYSVVPKYNIVPRKVTSLDVPDLLPTDAFVCKQYNDPRHRRVVCHREYVPSNNINGPRVLFQDAPVMKSPVREVTDAGEIIAVAPQSSCSSWKRFPRSVNNEENAANE